MSHFQNSLKPLITLILVIPNLIIYVYYLFLCLIVLKKTKLDPWIISLFYESLITWYPKELGYPTDDAV